MPDPAPHPEFPWSLPALIAEGTLAMLRANAPLAAYMNAIRPHEAEDLFLEGTLAAPELGVVLSRFAESRSGSSRQTTGEVEVLYTYIHHLKTAPDAESWLRARVVDAVKAVIAADGGVVRCPFATDEYAEGQILTEGLLTFGAVVTPLRLPTAGLLVTPIRATFETTFNEATRRTLL